MTAPNSQDAERAVIGAILIGGMETFLRVDRSLSPDDFYNSNHQYIYQAMRDVHADGIVPDLVTVTARLKEVKRLSSAGGASYLSGAADDCPSALNVSHYVKIVKEKSKLRKIIDGARKISESASMPGADPKTIPTKLSIEIDHDAEVNQVATVIKSLNENIEKGYPGIHPCYNLLSRTIRKVSPGHLWVVGAYTSVGKSAWLVDFICRIYRYGMDNPGIAIFLTEMSCEQYLLRELSNYTTIPTWAITENSCRPEQIAALIKAQVFFSTRNLYLYDRLYRIEDMERTARMLKGKGLDIIAIDYLQNLWGEGSIYERMSRLAPVLQYLAKDLQVTIIALSQVSNQFQREKGSGGVFGYKGAGEIAASADIGIELERDQTVKEKMIFKVVKNRHGRIGEGVLEYVHGYTKFDEVVEDQPEYGG
jgi:replicative DNA helicase